MNMKFKLLMVEILIMLSFTSIYGYVLMNLWKWFVVPLVGIHLSYSQASGLCFVFWLVFWDLFPVGKARKIKIINSFRKAPLISFINHFSYAGIFLIGAYIIKSFI